MGASIRRPHSFLLAILAVVLLSAGGLVAWAASPSRRPARRPHAARSSRPTRPSGRPARRSPAARRGRRVRPRRFRVRSRLRRPVVRVVPRAAPVVLHDTEPETDVVVRDADGLPPTALETVDGEGDGEANGGAPPAHPVTGVGEDLALTVTVDGQETPVRLLGVAEAKAAEGDLPLTPEAFLRNLLAGEFVQLVADQTLEETDEEGRRVAYVYRVPDGLLVNLELVRQGYAVTAREYAFDHLDAFLIYQRRARADHRGLWATVADPPEAVPLAEAAAE